MQMNSNIYLTAPRQAITDLDALPVTDRSLVNYETYSHFIGQGMFKNAISFQATRGCPFQCVYCHRIWPRKHYTRSAGNLFAELKLYYDLGIRRFSFVDDIFNFDLENSTRFFRMVVESKLDVHLIFPAGLRGDILTKDYIDLMIEAGTRGFALALETASPRLQKLIKKNLNIDKLHKNMDYICTAYPQVLLELFTMHGFPTETEQEARMTLDFIKSLKWIHFPYVSTLRIYPHTEMEKVAIENGISQETIIKSQNLAYHQLPETLPFEKSFTFQYQTEFLHEYFLLKERLLNVLPQQMKILTQDEMAQKYNSYLPREIKSLDDILATAGINRREIGVEKCVEEDFFRVPDLDKKMKQAFPQKNPRPDALRVLLLDLSIYFSSHKKAMLYDVLEPPLGLMCLLSFLNQQTGNKVRGKIAKSRIDFDNYAELKELLEGFQPQVIGIRTLTFYQDFLHQTAAKIRQWGINAPIILGGPYATSDYERILRDRNIDLCVLGEGEVTFTRLIETIINNHGSLPDEKNLEQIPGIAFLPKQEKPGWLESLAVLELE